ncbi:hypothetical protein [Erwinia aphidicola]|uniref:hypothetical protein n=1 Tax=Erwinia aphidicola TaxID=68334 RepID=UPI0020A1FC1F|nr:hypothetical protein [Erwinia aphidicola]MCP2234015.1 hypothetical protein [Erwinia aphidicola]
MSKMVFWNKNAARTDWRDAFLVDGVYRASPEATAWTLEQLNADGGNFEMVTFEEAYQRHCDTYILAPVEISAERFNDMLELLPPLDWHIGASSQSFRLMEMTCVNVTAIFAVYGGRYFELCDRVTLTHDEIIGKIRGSIGAKQSAA